MALKDEESKDHGVSMQDMEGQKEKRELLCKVVQVPAPDGLLESMDPKSAKKVANLRKEVAIFSKPASQAIVKPVQEEVYEQQR